VSLARLRPPVPFLTWFGLLGAPFAWTIQHVVGITLAEAACSQSGTRWAVPVDTGTLVATASSTLVALLAGAAAVAAFMATRDVGTDPPGARIHFLATVGVVVTPIFMVIVLLSGVTVVLFPECHQA
jgi:hypothetical protein